MTCRTHSSVSHLFLLFFSFSASLHILSLLPLSLTHLSLHLSLPSISLSSLSRISLASQCISPFLASLSSLSSFSRLSRANLSFLGEGIESTSLGRCPYERDLGRHGRAGGGRHASRTSAGRAGGASLCASWQAVERDAGVIAIN